MRLWAIVLSLVVAEASAAGFEVRSRGYSTVERCIVLESECHTYVLNVAMAHKLESGRWRARGWMNLYAGQTVEVCWSSVNSDVWILVNKPNDDIGCFINPISQKGPFVTRKQFCINTDGGFDIQQSNRKKPPRFYLGFAKRPDTECEGPASCFEMMNFEKFKSGPRHSIQPQRLKCP